MRIAIISDWFSESMGYAENCLPKALASLGHEVHLVTSDAQVYFESPLYGKMYEPYLGPAIVRCVTKKADGYTLHRLPHAKWRGRFRIRGMTGLLSYLKPQVVQTFDTHSQTTVETALAKPLIGYKLFTANHAVASVFPYIKTYGTLHWREKFFWLRHAAWPGRLANLFSDKCFPATVDAEDIAVRFMGISKRKSVVIPLGVDTDLFHPVQDEDSRRERAALRNEHGFADTDIVCLYTGRFAEDKVPLCLARAIDLLAGQSRPYRGLFVGNGPQDERIRACRGCVVHQFIPFTELPPYYRAADIGVWPTQESTSMLDAAASGIPIVVSDRLLARERVVGNGLQYRQGDEQDLARALSELSDSRLRQQLGQAGTLKMQRDFSWIKMAQRRLEYYQPRP
ncbi:MAG: glycosyltransferase family 4 protein [Candidatus Edwardsbacteria bacterium]|nr:glycosyltransferase family 4 protein [Candidatus Edwardsbacteria bacterium]